MSSPNLLPRALRWAAVAALGLGLSACFRPLYGPTASGAPLASVLAAIQVEPVVTAVGQERLGHYLRSELVYDLDGSGQPRPKRYKLSLNATESLTLPITDSVTNRADAVTVNGSVAYTLTTLDGTRVVTTGRAFATAAYDRNFQRFANVRAARDAEIRIGKVLAEQIRTRLATVIATEPIP